MFLFDVGPHTHFFLSLTGLVAMVVTAHKGEVVSFKTAPRHSSVHIPLLQEGDCLALPPPALADLIAAAG